MSDQIVVAEGIETALAAAELLGLPAWASLSAAGLRSLRLPRDVRRVTIAADADRVGRAAADEAARRWTCERRTVRIVEPVAPHKDFADVILAECGVEGVITRPATLEAMA